MLIGWKSRDEMASDFEAGTGRWEKFKIADDFPTDEQILLGARGWGSYCGDAFVLFERDGKLYEVNGGHCSCYGLEGQWTPEETTWAALAMRKRDYDDWADGGAWEALQALIAKNRP